MTSSTFVLVHGAWHGGWCWQRVAGPLRARGHRVTTPTQTGLGERAHLLSPAITLETFVADLVNHLVFEDLNDVILVGHSFAGASIAGAAERARDRIARLVYLDAMVLEAGMRPIDQLPPEVARTRQALAERTSGGLSLPPPDPDAFGVTDPDEAAWVSARLTPHPWSTYTSALPITGPVGAGLPCRYVLCSAPRYTAIEAALAEARAAGWPIDTLAAGHDAMITDPGAVIALLDP